MGLFSGLKFAANAAEQVDRVTAALGGITDPSVYPIASPWATRDLQRIVFEDVFGTTIPVNTREAAMKLPAIARGRNRIVSSCARQPLRAMLDQGPGVDDVPAPTQPHWLTHCGDGTSPQLRLAWTVDDLMFYGWSCWWRDDVGGHSRLNQGDWSIDDDMRVEVDGSPVRADQVIVIPGLHEGILSFGVDTLNDARNLYAAVRARLASPLPGVDLHQTGGEPLTDIEIDALIARWVAARTGKYGGVGYTSENIEAKPIEAGDEQLMIEGRNAMSVDLARLIGIAAAAVDATNAGASLTYETTQGRNQEFVDFDLDTYLGPIAWRLSQDDVLPTGQYAAFDLAQFTSLTPAPTGPNLED